MSNAQSIRLFKEAERHLPGGVNSPVRAFKSVGGTPPFIERAKGAKIYDADGRAYIDYVLSWGPMILGHAHPQVVRAVTRAAENGMSFGAPTELEIKLAKLVKSAFPSIELVRMVNSGTEAVMSAIRVARGFTKREKILKFEGCYHGHADHLLVRAGSGAATLGVPDSLGVPPMTARQTITAPYNDITTVKRIFEREGKNIACVIVEPVAGNMGVVPPRPRFLQGLRSLTKQYDSLLVFDEVITGFRVHRGGAQGLFKIVPDLTCLGKILGGGLPVGAYGGRREIMERIAPLGPVYQAGTLSGNPLAMTAGIETLTLLRAPGVYRQLEVCAKHLGAGLEEEARRAGVPVCSTRVGSMLGLFFTRRPVVDFATAKTSDTSVFTRYFHGLLDRGIYTAPSQFEAMFLSIAHTPQMIERTIRAARTVFRTLA
ncbi:MAG TPA: glutamate-1-semialdehyde-2,1-aminomutase [Nitrospirales bacterium]|nr:glutamate-1-semialdehyde-2,1-aminomutase [Nitrospirales bacterium]HIA13957.1 glutamate-1-semialdehyde-2,1-aminomutase [Nitrospirales bacterium]HIB54466.1 glutamate-1-semialdehyde-2,1-aminomutase [Nitrospirales bacterium]HIN32815.1 glutamate-1-semialdehyde-2,1-aminomutase [Nitrospirales bacterium]HIO20946.1 glutamate-1-semialdehyde-2,1-aminomutase [Nitrospirales bacterium]